MDNPTNLPMPLPKQAFEHLTGHTASGDDVELYVEQEVNVAYVSITSADFGYIQFNFDPDGPDDAKKCFLAFCELRSIEFEGRS